ncbi:hypothetical protein AB0I28_32615 [Phytomonospora sp. NPDC050363]|uniref:hypothetical protein n=1 Tax=Phytomonospora sp. NPDC050363 TaxID=3155642 RepID=UPI003410546B
MPHHDTTANGDVVDRTWIVEHSGLSRDRVNVLARTDPAFPAPIEPPQRGRRARYPLEAAQAYLRVLDERRQAALPPVVATGHADDDLVGVEEAAHIYGVDTTTFRAYVTASKALWDDGADARRPMVPAPDVDEPAPIQGRTRRWTAGRLRAHRAASPGPGAGAGRPPAAGTRRATGDTDTEPAEPSLWYGHMLSCFDPEAGENGECSCDPADAIWQCLPCDTGDIGLPGREAARQAAEAHRAAAHSGQHLAVTDYDAILLAAGAEPGRS